MTWNLGNQHTWAKLGTRTGTAVLCAAAALSGCSKTESPSSSTTASDAGASSAPAASAAPTAAAGKTKIGFSVSTLNNAFFVGLKLGVEKGSQEQGFDLVQTNANGDAQQQVNDAINLLSQGISAWS